MTNTVGSEIDDHTEVDHPDDNFTFPFDDECKPTCGHPLPSNVVMADQWSHLN